jgi:hypothetical protein
MAIKAPNLPAIETPEDPPLQTAPQRSGGWFTRLKQRVKLAMSGNDEILIVENTTPISWKVYHNYHQLGIIDASEERPYKLVKHGSLNVRPIDGDQVEYIVLSLDSRVHRVLIYQRSFGKDVEVYDLRVG